MGAYDVINWYAELPDLPAGFQPWHFDFQTKDLPRPRQRQFEVTLAGRLQERIPKATSEPLDDEPDQAGQRLVRLMDDLVDRRKSGQMKNSATHDTALSSFTGSLRLSECYGPGRSGRLMYQVELKNGTVVSVALTHHRAPDENAQSEAKSGAMAQFIVKPLGPGGRSTKGS